MNEISSYRNEIQAPNMISWIIIFTLISIIVLMAHPAYMVYVIDLLFPIADVLCRMVMHIMLTVKFVFPTLALS